MKIESLRIENFRSFKDETIFFDDYTCFVGANGSGKSTVLNALNVFFRQNKDCQTDLSKLTEEDFHHKNINSPIKITVTFCDLSIEAKEDLSDYVRQEKLIVTSVAEFNASVGFAEVKQYGNRMGIEEFRKYFELDKSGAKVDELKSLYSKLQESFPDLPKATTKPAMIESLHEYEAKHPKRCVLIPSEDQFYGVSKGVNRLAKHIQWVFIAATKDFTEESQESKTSALGQLLLRTVRSKVNFTQKIKELKERAQAEYQTIIDSEQITLNGISTSLSSRLASWAHPGISTQVLWKQESDKSVKVEEPWAYVKISERGFDGELARFGHGLQRSYMLAILQELSTTSDESAPTLLMAIEEPEIYQHPPQARYLAEVLHELSAQKSQIILCSHNPLFIPGDNFEAVRIIREKGDPPYSYASSLKYPELSKILNEAGQTLLKENGILAKLYPSLNPIINEMFFCKCLVLTEGIEDVAYISTYLMLMGRNPEFRRNGCHIVPVNGKSELIKPLAIANLLHIPTFIVCDADTNKDLIEDEQRQKSEVEKHKIDNRAILNLCGQKNATEWPREHLHFINITMWTTNLTDSIETEMGAKWKEFMEEAYSYYGKPGGLQKNPLAIARALEKAWETGLKSSLLEKLIESIIEFSNKKLI